MTKFRWVASYDLIVAGYLIGFIALAAWLGLNVDYSVILDFKYHAPFIAIMLLYVWIMAIVVAVRERKAGRDRVLCGRSWWAEMRRAIFNVQFAYDTARLLLYLKLMFVIYGNIKQAIPRINPHLCDQALYTIDTWAHLGIDPIDAIHAMFPTKWSMLAMDFLYVAWYAVLAPTVAAFLTTPDRRRKSAFFSAFFLLWIIGGLLAVAVPSLGPIYVNPERFAHVAMPQARELQEMLWVNYQKALANPEEYRALLYEGIAAFPSLHVGVIAMFAMFLLQWNKPIGWLMVGYTIIIQLGSVMTGWHYAVDGYATILLAVGLWWMMRPRSQKSDAIPNLTLTRPHRLS